jgi:sarcosine oxidase
VAAEVAVVGAGVNGLAAAHALVRTGRDVVVYEQFELGHTRGSSHGRTRIFRVAYPDPKWVRRAVEALAAWRELEAESREELLLLNGLIELVAKAEESSEEALAECGLACRVLTAAEAEREFGLVPPDGSRVVFQPDAGIIYAERAMEVFARGVEIVEGRRIESLDEVTEPVVVVTAGPWARKLLAPAGIDLPVVESRETVVFFRLDGEPLPVVAEIVLRGHGFYALADPLYGLKVGRHMRGTRADPDQVHGPDEEVVQEVIGWTRERFPRADPNPVGAEACFYTNTDDLRFVLERHGRIIVGSACSGHGFKFAPAVGEELAALAEEALDAL